MNKLPSGSSNNLIDALPNRQRDRLLEACKPVALKFGDVLCELAQPVRHAYFPRSGFISLVSTLRGHKAMEIGLIGFEGMLGDTLVLGNTLAPIRAVVQGSGDAWRIPIAKLRRGLNDNAALRAVLNQYLYSRVLELSLGSACTRFHQVEQRLARWLLLTHDRSRSDSFYLTHEYLADMLGVRRSSVTVAAGALQHRGQISYSRGEIHILDRPGLEAAACDCYAVLN